MVTNLNLSYSQELGLLETHHFHLHPALCWEGQSTWPDEGFVLLWDTALSQIPELPPLCHSVTTTDTAQVPLLGTFSHNAQSIPVPHTLKACPSLLLIGDLKLLSLECF